jgi:trans-2,3-dihydro-3-hydroxyanthranilate isomerase
MRVPVEVTVVDACLRAGAGGSPTAVVTSGDDLDFTRIPPLAGTSHVAVIGRDRSVRFFTADGELPGCGHGTVAAIAVLAAGAAGFDGRLRAGGRDFAASGVSSAGTVEAWFDQGPVALEPAGAELVAAFLDAIGLAAPDPGDPPVLASPGRSRLLLPVTDRGVLAALRPDQERLARVSRRFGQLGCFVHTGSPGTAARMFAPAIGVPEDVANANSTGCLAAHRRATGHDPAVAVDQGDTLGRPSTVRATATATTTLVGGTARISHRLRAWIQPGVRVSL